MLAVGSAAHRVVNSPTRGSPDVAVPSRDADVAA